MAEDCTDEADLNCDYLQLFAIMIIQNSHYVFEWYFYHLLFGMEIITEALF